MDAALARKVHDKGPLAACLSGLASKHEVEALRRWGLLEGSKHPADGR